MFGFADGYLIEFGHFSVFTALMVTAFQALAPWLATRLRVPVLAHSGTQASYIILVLLSIGAGTLMHAFVTADFSVRYVAQHSNTQLPLLYKVTAFWGGHEGSLYLWAWVLSVFSVILAVQGKKRFPQRLPVLLSVQAWLMLGFLGLILFLSNPFERLFPAAMEGRDLNPLLQDPGMAFHPPMLYLGYVGFSVPFAFALTALITRWETTLWIGLIRRWAIIAWTFLTIGIMLGGWWAYYELGWGGYWAWDPVENASFMPWLLGTALIHSVTVQENRHMLQTWNLFLAITTFSLSLLGTFLVRSGVLSSVHAFAVDPGRGVYILLFMGAVLVVSFGLFLLRGRGQPGRETIQSLMSREAMFVGNNILFSVLCLCVMLGTLYPLALEAINGAKITVGAPYFNAVIIPLFLLVLLLMAIAPATPWRKVDVKRLFSRLWPALAVGVLSAVIFLVVKDVAHWTAPVASGLVVFVFTTILLDIFRSARRRAHQSGESNVVALKKMLSRNRRYYGGMTVHFGIAVIALGLIGSGFFKQEQIVLMGKGDVLKIGNEELRFEGTQTFRKDNYHALQARLKLSSGNVLTPERRRYPVQTAPVTESSIDSTLWRDVYVVIGEKIGDRYTVHAYVNPLVMFIWIGAGIIVLGVLWSLSQRIRQRTTEEAS